MLLLSGNSLNPKIYRSLISAITYYLTGLAQNLCRTGDDPCSDHQDTSRSARHGGVTTLSSEPLNGQT